MAGISTISVLLVTLDFLIALSCAHALLLCGDVESNPGPRKPKFPCGECHKACTSYRGAKASILCESCDTWFHADCVNIDNSFLGILGRCDEPWECCNCGLPNYSSSLFDTLVESYSTDSSSSTSDCSNSSLRTSGSFSPDPPQAASSPTKNLSSERKQHFKTLTINFQSIISKREEFWCLIDAVKPDVIMGCETWLKPSISVGEAFPPGYNVYRKDRIDGYGGVLLAVSASLNSHQVDITSDAEAVAAKVVNGPTNNNSVIFGAVYRPPNTDQQYLDNMNQFIRDVCTSNPGAAVWIGGDMNLPDINWEREEITSHQYRHSLSESYLQTLGDVGVEQIVNFPTRGDNTLDVIITNRPTLVRQCEPMPGLSDHDVVFMDMTARAYRNKPTRREIFLWNKANLEALHIDAEAWADQFMETHDTSTPVETLLNEIQQGLEKILTDNVPKKMSSTRLNQCWFNTATKRICRKKARAYKKAKATSSWHRYNVLKKKAQKVCRQAYNKYIEDLLSNDAGCNKRLGALVKTMRCDHLGVAPLKEGNILHCDPKQKARILNKQFSSVFTSDDDNTLPDLGPSPYPTMPDISISQAGVEKLMKRLKPHKATGPDGISAQLLKETSHQISPVITLLFRASLIQGSIPSQWKKAFVVPIHKKGCKSTPANYRPISLTAILSKLCEHVVHCAVIHHLIEHNILSDAQHGFRKRRSCETQLILTINDLAKGLNDKEQIDCILLDFAKAFDKVSHRRLLLKADYYGIRGTTLRWVESFLSDRTQQVVLEGQTSQEIKVTSGVPQGSALGPLLFLIYINDLPDSVEHSTTRLFADDCLLYRHIRSDQDCTNLQEDLDRLQEWESKWKMEFHPSKCQILRVTNKRKQVTGQYNIHGHDLEVVSSAKYLGLHIDCKLNFNSHVDTTVKKANSVTGFLRRNFKHCSRHIKQATYFTYVRPVVEYAATAWDPHTQRNINKIEMVQRRCARYVTGDFNQTSSVTAMLNNLQWHSLQDRRLHSRLAMMYRIRFNLVDIAWQSYLSERTSATRGHGSRLQTFRCSNQAYASSFFPRTCKDWNSLQEDPASSSSLDAFRLVVSGKKK